MIAYFKELFSGIASLLTGLGITGRYFFRKPVTVLYPKQRIPMKRFKGPISFVVSEKTNDHLCIACNACIKACPSRCMSLKADKNTQNQRILTDFKVDHMLCSLCSICIDVCPTDALAHDAKNYHETALNRSELVHDLLEPFRKRGIDLNRPVKMPQKQTTEAKKP